MTINTDQTERLIAAAMESLASSLSIIQQLKLKQEGGPGEDLAKIQQLSSASSRLASAAGFVKKAQAEVFRAVVPGKDEEYPFNWNCPYCHHYNRDYFNPVLGPTVSLTCSTCDREVSEEALTAEDAQEWLRARRAAGNIE